MHNIPLAIGIISLILALIIGIADAVWDIVEDDVAKQQKNGKI